MFLIGSGKEKKALMAGEWELVGEGYRFTDGLCGDAFEVGDPVADLCVGVGRCGG